MSVMSTHPGSIDAAIPPASWFWAGVIRVDDALGGAARRRHVALCQRGIGAFEVIVFPALVDLQADRIVRIIGLGSSRRRCRSHPNCQNRQSQNAHQTLFISAVPEHGTRHHNWPNNDTPHRFRHGFRGRGTAGHSQPMGGVSWAAEILRTSPRRIAPPWSCGAKRVFGQAAPQQFVSDTSKHDALLLG